MGKSFEIVEFQTFGEILSHWWRWLGKQINWQYLKLAIKAFKVKIEKMVKLMGRLAKVNYQKEKEMKNEKYTKQDAIIYNLELRLYSVKKNSSFEIAGLFHHLNGAGKSVFVKILVVQSSLLIRESPNSRIS